MLTNQKGFTLIESLLVLTIFMIISMVTAINIKPNNFLGEDEVFFSQLKADFLYGQQYAISHQCDVTVIFNEEQFHYSLNTRPDLPSLIERNYSSNIKAVGGSLPLYFKFLPDGNINKFGTFYFKTNVKRYRITFLIGRGRFYVSDDG